LTHAGLAIGIGTARFAGGATPPASVPWAPAAGATTGMLHEAAGTGSIATTAGAPGVRCGKAAECWISDCVGITDEIRSPWPGSTRGVIAMRNPASPAIVVFIFFPTSPIRPRQWNMARDSAWRQPGECPSLHGMPTACFRMSLRLAQFAALSLCAMTPCMAVAQGTWTGVGAINGTVMYMDTTTIVRSGNLRKVWIRSIDPAPKSFVAGKDTLDFDTVIGLNVFDCSKHTRTVTTITYLLGNDIIFNVPETHDKPEQLKPRSFFDAVYNDLCGVRH
jgi:hypothetical protein